jgi:hypothetical protein
MRGHRAIAGGRADVRKLLFMAAVTAIRHGTRRAVVAKAETRWSGPSSRRRSWLRQEAVPDKANELAAIPPLLERLGAEDGLKGALVSIDANATNPAVAEAITAQGAGWLLAVKANQPTLRAEVEAAFAEAGDGLDACATLDKGTAASSSAA